MHRKNRESQLQFGMRTDDSPEIFVLNPGNNTEKEKMLGHHLPISNVTSIGADPGSPGLVFEKKLDYVGAGTLGDIMSDPDEEASSSRKYHRSSWLKENITKHHNNDVDGIQEDTHKGKTRNDSSEHRLSLSGQESPTKSGLVTADGGNLQSQFKHKIRNPSLSPLERIALTANGNLQRIFSSYYDAPVHVRVERCEIRLNHRHILEGDLQNSNNLNAAINPLEILSRSNGMASNYSLTQSTVWDRTVHLSVHNKIFCVAVSTVTVHCPLCKRLVDSGEVGIGQLFRHLDKLPTFELLDAGRTEDEGLWRFYELRCKELTCEIREDFSMNAWTILAPNS